MAISRPMPRWCWPSRPARTRARWPRQIAAALKRRPGRRSGRRGRPGFVNLQARRRLLAGRIWPRSSTPAPITAARRSAPARKVNVEYVSANPTGPMHVGHCRGAVVGDALANLLAFAGYEVTKEYLHQRRRRADRRARPLGDAALPRGAGRRDRRDPGRALSRRLSRAGRPGAGRRVRPRACCRCRKTRRWRSSRTAPSTP